MPREAMEQPKLKRVIHLPGAMMMGLGSIVGTGVFVSSGIAAGVAGPAVVLAGFLAVWGASVIADSGVFSTALSETADQRFVGTALTVQTAVGFTLTVLTIQALPALAEAVGWQFAFWLLAPGPLLGALAMRRFRLVLQDKD